MKSEWPFSQQKNGEIPSFGSMVQKGKFSALACVLVSKLNSDDLPRSTFVRKIRNISVEREWERVWKARAWVSGDRTIHVRCSQSGKIQYLCILIKIRREPRIRIRVQGIGSKEGTEENARNTSYSQVQLFCKRVWKIMLSIQNNTGIYPSKRKEGTRSRKKGGSDSRQSELINIDQRKEIYLWWALPTLGRPTMPILRWFFTRPSTGFFGASAFFAMTRTSVFRINE